MNKNKNLPLRMGLRYGVAFGIVVTSFAVIRYKTGMILRDDHTLSYVYWTIFAISLFFATYQFKKIDPSSFSVSRTIKIGMIAGLVSGLMYTIYIMILNNYIDTGLSSKIVRELNERLLTQRDSQLSNDINDSIKIMKMNSSARGLIYTTVCMIVGTIYSFGSAIVVKRLSKNAS